MWNARTITPIYYIIYDLICVYSLVRLCNRIHTGATELKKKHHTRLSMTLVALTAVVAEWQQHDNTTTMIKHTRAHNLTLRVGFFLRGVCLFCSWVYVFSIRDSENIREENLARFSRDALRCRLWTWRSARVSPEKCGGWAHKM